MNGLLLVFLGGGLGSVCRYAISRYLNQAERLFPFGTLMANILSCLILALAMLYLYKQGLNQKFQLLIMTGFCGGFSTFSSFSAETFRMIEHGHWALAITYVLASVVSCVLIIFGCYYLGLKYL